MDSKFFEAKQTVAIQSPCRVLKFQLMELKSSVHFSLRHFVLSKDWSGLKSSITK